VTSSATSMWIAPTGIMQVYLASQTEPPSAALALQASYLLCTALLRGYWRPALKIQNLKRFSPRAGLRGPSKEWEALQAIIWVTHQAICFPPQNCASSTGKAGNRPAGLSAI